MKDESDSAIAEAFRKASFENIDIGGRGGGVGEDSYLVTVTLKNDALPDAQTYYVVYTFWVSYHEHTFKTEVSRDRPSGW